MAKPTVKIHQLEVNGFLSSSGVAHFLGLQYASIPARFRQAKLIDPRDQIGSLDATNYGPRCPQPPDAAKKYREHLFAGAGVSESWEDEFDCLNLNVYAPVEALASSKLPVLVWIHGGAWVLGDGQSEFTGEYLVRYSMDIGKPCVFVGLNYRLGYFGFLSSKELEEEALGHGEAGWTNQGLFDQRLALQWVHDNIHFFGGDSNNITLAGQSAGAWSVLAHIKSTVPVCQRAIILSDPSWNFPSEQQNQTTFDNLVSKTGTSETSPASQKLSALRSLSPTQLIAISQSSPMTPMFDPKWFPSNSVNHRLDLAPHNFPSWLHGIIAGYTKDELVLFNLPDFFPTKPTIIDAIKTSLTPSCPPEFTESILSTYSISTADSDASAQSCMITLCSDSLFSRTPFYLSSSPSPPISLYRFDQPDLYPQSRYKGLAYHSLDTPYFCRMPALAGPDAAFSSTRETANAFSNAILSFVAAEGQPWECFTDGQKVMVFDGKQSGLRDLSDDLIRWRDLLSGDNEVEKEILFSGLARNILGLRGRRG